MRSPPRLPQHIGSHHKRTTAYSALPPVLILDSGHIRSRACTRTFAFLHDLISPR